ncbi:Stp1/IreP family PP2C-type Ser/Thr phosphatase [Priestia koreensis]|uniref:protein-serine/threonine phosphatase n=1 Tax=Priestia koreensis TaxID=284581 RepID=A0A0M0KPF7_9BACI|nr:Stp1/IreP family PP2C-type Ser/Thr phosphatase [Priestia koreensis]KOO40695.1 protein phosphatase [Priestia koreensis]MCM3003822.1 Stp1/IreP family PP2C-type Ser/Thr phosphatase [Priestia koreensis]UNL83924.1 Stp1/IreP family PP2C-type Ser/Thr phosphatase [Priestia koreensis]
MGVVFMTDRGKVRQHNEDSGGVFVNRYGQSLAVVADGMGGHRAGDVASSLAIKELKQYWEESEKLSSPDVASRWMKEKITQVNQHLFQYSQEHEECRGMGTTVVMAVCTDSFCTVGNIGDSRCYILNENGFSQLTEDHSLVNELVKSGQISREDAEHHPRKNILMRALGTEERVYVDIKTIEIEAEDQLLLCSDGLSNKVSTEQLKETLASSLTLEEKAASLIQQANDSGGEDNITLVIVDFTNGSG